MAAMIIEQEANTYLDWPTGVGDRDGAVGVHAGASIWRTGRLRTRGRHPRLAMIRCMTGGVSRRGSALLLTLLVVFLVAPVVVVALMSFTNQHLSCVPANRVGDALVYRGVEPTALVDAGLEQHPDRCCNGVAVDGAGHAECPGCDARGATLDAAAVASLVVAPMMLPHIIIAIGLYPTMLDLGLSNTYIGRDHRAYGGGDAAGVHHRVGCFTWLRSARWNWQR